MYPRSRSLIRLVPACTAVFLGACGGEGPTDPGRNGDGGIRILFGAGVADTVDAVPVQALVVEVRDTDGALMSGALVRFEAQRSADSSRAGEPAMFVCPLSAASCGGSMNYAFQQLSIDTTDAQGRAKAMLRLGHVAGPAHVRITVPELGVVDTAEFTVRPGAVARVLAPADTTLLIGATVKPAARVTDRYANARTEAPTVTVGTGSALQLAATGDVSAREIGVQSLHFRHGQLADTMRVSVVPSGRLAVWRGYGRSLHLVNLDGTGMRTLLTAVSSDYGAFPSFDASRQRVTAHVGSESYGGPSRRVVTVDTTGAITLDVTAAGYSTVIRAREMADGRLLIVGRLEEVNGVWSVTGGGAPVLVAELPDFSLAYGGADISPDGSRVAYVAYAGYSTELRARELATGGETILAAEGSSPRWSPQGDRLAYLSSSGRLTIVAGDGSGRRTLGTRGYSPGIAWSPAGEYVVARSSGYEWTESFWLVRVQDAVEVPLRFPSNGYGIQDYYQPDWR